MRTPTRRALSALVPGAVALMLMACSTAVTGPNATFLATIEADGPVIITLPDRAVAGESFDVTIVTFANRGCEELGPTEVAIDGLTASITPFDQQNGHRFCADQSMRVKHVARVTFATSGMGTILVRGISSVLRDTIDVTRTIVIQ